MDEYSSIRPISLSALVRTAIMGNFGKYEIDVIAEMQPRLRYLVACLSI